MPILEYDYNNKDYELVANQTDGSFGSAGDYIRLIVYESSRNSLSPNNVIAGIVNDAGITSKAIFYSSLSESEFDINISPFYSNTTNLTPYTIGGDKNEAQPKIVRRENAVEIKLPREHVIFGDIPENLHVSGNVPFYREWEYI